MRAMNELRTYADAVTAVRDGASPREAAAALVATLTPDEKLWCLDGDAPTWAGLTFLATDGYHKAPFVGAENERVGIGGIRFSLSLIHI